MTDRGVSYEGNRPPPQRPASSSERRVALVIGNGAYSHAAPLENPVRDADAMAARLAKLGFDVVKGLDLNLRALGDVQSAFEDKLRVKPDVALLFYAGHGLQVEGRNYLVPIDAEITAKSHLATRALHFNDLLDDMARDAGASLIFLDACRDNPFTRNLARSMGDTARYAGVRGGLARIEKVAGTFIAYATAPDQVAYDGKGDNSPFTSALLQHIETPGLSVGDLMIDVRNKVLAETNNRQEPWDQSSLRARFYFVPPEPEVAPQPQPASEAASEWAAIQGTTSLAVLAKFQERFPDPPWFDYAEARANELRAADAARVAAEEAERHRAEAAAQADQQRQRERDAGSITTPLSQQRTKPLSADRAKQNERLAATILRIVYACLAGASMFAFPFVLGFGFRKNSWSFLGPQHGAGVSGALIGIAVSIVAAVMLVRWQRATVTGYEIAIYWLSCALMNVFVLLIVTPFFGWRPDTSGMFVGASLSVAAAVILVCRRGATVTGYEVAIYCIGCTLMNVVIFVFIFDVADLSFLGPYGADQGNSGALVGIALSIAAGVALRWKWQALKAYLAKRSES